MKPKTLKIFIIAAVIAAAAAIAVFIAENAVSAHKAAYSDKYISLGYLPEGYGLAKKYCGTGLTYVFLNDNGNTLFVDVSKPGGIMQIDTEGCETAQRLISGHEAALFYGGRINSVIWTDDYDVLSVYGNVDEEEIVKVAENLRKKFKKLQ